ncbi:MAG TPA: hypothetical protein DCR44_05770 [Acholeplasmatales bacterium]|nr:MAG: hypothetical protein A2Y16_03050 [Tenericutes bacterium GWF2_57_13]HAQ56886.1 hypothetical protein [Acholeplasmatales bacterium]
MKKELTAEKILDAALTEFAERGFRAASTNRIAALADVAKGSVFQRFGSKALLFGALFTRELDRMLEELDNFDATVDAPVFERIVDVLAWKARYAAGHPEATKILLEAFSAPPAGVGETIATRVRDLSQMSIRRFFGELDWSRFRPELTKEDVYRILETAANGLQATYVRAGIDVRYMESIRNDSVAFMKTVVRGMEKQDGQGV